MTFSPVPPVAESEVAESEGAESEASARKPSQIPGWMHRVVQRTESEMKFFLDGKIEMERQIAGETSGLAECIEDFSLRGGKRLRASGLVAAYASLSAQKIDQNLPAILDEVFPTCIALELLQSYLLLHDDWMDGDETRRGKPTAHRLFAKTSPFQDLAMANHFGASMAILAGDLCAAYAIECIATQMKKSACGSLLDTYLQLHNEVILGQELDLKASPNLARMQELKTGSYTVWGPLRLAGALSQANDATVSGLFQFASNLGRAFQVRDDLISNFGDPTITGKAQGMDLWSGKRTSIVEAYEQLASKNDRQRLQKFLRAPEEHAHLFDSIREDLREQVTPILEKTIQDLHQSALQSLLELDSDASRWEPLLEWSDALVNRSK